jgi:mannose-6-phosphate isomerase-like protein (cupin superfamily)
MVLPDYIEKNFINGREPHKENLVGCSGVGQALIWQVLAPWEGKQHTGADAMLYVIGGEGTIKLSGRDVSLRAGSFAVVPRGSTYSLTRRGRNPLILLAMLAGAPCAA